MMKRVSHCKSNCSFATTHVISDHDGCPTCQARESVYFPVVYLLGSRTVLDNGKLDHSGGGSIITALGGGVLKVKSTCSLLVEFVSVYSVIRIFG